MPRSVSPVGSKGVKAAVSRMLAMRRSAGAIGFMRRLLGGGSAILPGSCPGQILRRPARAGKAPMLAAMCAAR
ncbi:hypothetical protein LNKW23_27470 [Paralimibaculum aggregatum]|uniref:Uncharacterized protein n=1 Tax=Paralimibaculum aggregatum TaxID=3036245 RepID=A0ABQ6LQZ0_9RHOB|nr:hypothetical protein LNKW23_27470 [Limibaculum sp. NKW23]